MKNSKKNAATTKKDYQAALMKKAAKKANATSVVDSVNTDNISITADTAPMRKVNGKALQYALAYLLSNYPAIETTRKSDFKDVFNMLLKLNVDLTSKKEISAETGSMVIFFASLTKEASLLMTQNLLLKLRRLASPSMRCSPTKKLLTALLTW